MCCTRVLPGLSANKCKYASSLNFRQFQTSGAVLATGQTGPLGRQQTRQDRTGGGWPDCLVSQVVYLYIVVLIEWFEGSWQGIKNIKSTPSASRGWKNYFTKSQVGSFFRSAVFSTCWGWSSPGPDFPSWRWWTCPPPLCCTNSATTWLPGALSCTLDSLPHLHWPAVPQHGCLWRGPRGEFVLAAL